MSFLRYDLYTCFFCIVCFLVMIKVEILEMKLLIVCYLLIIFNFFFFKLILNHLFNFKLQSVNVLRLLPWFRGSEVQMYPKILDKQAESLTQYLFAKLCWFTNDSFFCFSLSLTSMGNIQTLVIYSF